MTGGRRAERHIETIARWIVEEAGGKITDCRGGKLDPEGSRGLVASNGALHPDLLRVTGEYRW